MSDELYRRVVEQTPDAIIMADTGGVIKVWNKGAQALFGFTAEEALGKTVDIIIPEPTRDQHWTGFDRALADKKSKYERDVLFTRANNKAAQPIYVEMTLTVLLDAAGTPEGAVAVIRDATAHRERERGLRTRITELEKQVKK